MARVKIEAIIGKLDSGMKRALEDALHRLVPTTRVDRTQHFKAFLKAVNRKCRTWEQVPDDLIEKTCRHCGKDA